MCIRRIISKIICLWLMDAILIELDLMFCLLLVKLAVTALAL